MHCPRKFVQTFILTFSLAVLNGSTLHIQNAQANPAVIGWDLAAGVAAAAGVGILMCKGVSKDDAVDRQARWLSETTQKPMFWSQVALNRSLSVMTGIVPARCSTARGLEASNMNLINAALLTSTLQVMGQISALGIHSHHYADESDDDVEAPLTKDEEAAMKVVKALEDTGIADRANAGHPAAKAALDGALRWLTKEQSQIAQAALDRLANGPSGKQVAKARLVTDPAVRALIEASVAAQAREAERRNVVADRILRALGLKG